MILSLIRRKHFKKNRGSCKKMFLVKTKKFKFIYKTHAEHIAVMNNG